MPLPTGPHLWQTAIRSPGLLFYGRHTRNPFNYIDHYSFTDPAGMEGWVGLVGWSIADTLPTKWSHVNHRSGKILQPQTDVLTTEPRRQIPRKYKFSITTNPTTFAQLSAFSLNVFEFPHLSSFSRKSPGQRRVTTTKEHKRWTFDAVAALDEAVGSNTSCDSRMLDACTEYFEPLTVFISSSRASTS